MERIDLALNAAPVAQAGRILLTKATIFEQNGDVQRAIEVLREAEMALNPRQEVRLGLVLRFNLTVCFCKVGRYTEAAQLIGEVKQIASTLQNELDSTRVVWLEARIAVGTGHFEKARAHLETVYDALASRGLDRECELAIEELNALPIEPKLIQTEVEEASKQPGCSLPMIER